MNYLLVFAGGGSGCLLRYLIGNLLHRSSLNFPVATFLANVISCALFALLTWWLHSKPGANELVRPLLLVGFCGGLSTFSAFSYENFLLFQKEMYLLGVINIVLSCLFCMSFFYILNKPQG
jgi:fluoride exporter